MSYNTGARIVRDGLVMYLDAANSKSIVSGSNSWRDLSGNINNATLTNGPTYTGSFGGSIIFDGSNDYGINASAPNGFNFNVTNAITAEAMIYYSPSSYDFWFSGNNSGIKYRFGTNPSGQFFWDMGQHVDRNYTSYVLPSNSWQHVTFTGGLEGGSIITRIYVNGNLITTQNEGISVLSTTSDFYVGAGETSTSWLFNGRIANLKIYNRALSASEILQNYNATKKRFGL